MPKPSVLSRIASAWTYPLHLEDFLAVVDPRHSARQLRGSVTAVTRETPTVTTLTLRPGRGWPPHRAGQWLRVGVEVAGVRHWRPFSISAPEGEPPAITVGSVGLVSTELARARVGDVLFLDAPQGDFTLPADLGPALFIAAGTGVTPLYSMLATLVARDPGADVVVVHIARTDADAVFADRLAALAEAHPGVRLIAWRSAVSGRLQLAAPSGLAALVPDWAQRSTYVCGPAALISDAEALWTAAGAGEGLHVERFTLTRTVDPDATGGTVRFSRSGATLPAPPGASLLEVGEASGLALPCGCRMGICRSCVAELRGGQVRDLVTGRVHGEPGELIRVCVSGAAGDVDLDA